MGIGNPAALLKLKLLLSYLAHYTQACADVLAPFPFEPIYGAWWDRVIGGGGKAVMEASVRRYVDAVSGPPVERG